MAIFPARLTVASLFASMNSAHKTSWFGAQPSGVRSPYQGHGDFFALDGPDFEPIQSPGAELVAAHQDSPAVVVQGQGLHVFAGGRDCRRLSAGLEIAEDQANGFLIVLLMLVQHVTDDGRLGDPVDGHPGDSLEEIGLRRNGDRLGFEFDRGRGRRFDLPLRVRRQSEMSCDRDQSTLTVRGPLLDGSAEPSSVSPDSSFPFAFSKGLSEF